MKSYLIPGLDAAQKQRLKSAGIQIYEWEDGILVEEGQSKEALAILGATATESATEYENMFKLSLRYSPAAPTRPADPVQNSARARSRQRYIEACSIRSQQMLKDTQEIASKTLQEVPSVQDRFFHAARQHAFAKTKDSEEALNQQFLQEFERLKQVPKVKAVRVVEGAILLYTETLYATNPDTGIRHELGRFMIYIRLDGRDDGVRWFNNTRRVDAARPGMNAPYVFADGRGCVDEIRQTFLELIARCEFAVVAELAIQFVETLNDDALAKHIDRWPSADSAVGDTV